jgi:hypothetical protein
VPDGYKLLPGVLHAYRASARDLAGYVRPRPWIFTLLAGVSGFHLPD